MATYWLTSGQIRDSVFVVTCAAPVGVIPFALWYNGIKDRVPWCLTMAGGAMLTAANVDAYVEVDLYGHSGPQLLFFNVAVAAGYGVLFVGTTTLIARHVREDRGGLIDASLVAICTAGALWDVVLLPRLQARGVASGLQLYQLICLLLVAGILGCVMRLVSQARRARAALIYVCLAIALTLSGLVFDGLMTDPVTHVPPVWLPCIWMGGNLALAAAAAHPGSRFLADARQSRPDEITTARLVFIGAALAANPVIGGLRQVLAMRSDGFLLAVGSLLVVPLVVLRVGQMARQRALAQHALAYQAEHDELTGLPNRRAILRQVEEALSLVAADQLPAVSVVFIDLNGFKPINDRLGHRAGDQLLVAVASHLTSVVRAEDAVGRIGGDEFLVLVTGPSDLEALSSRLCEAVTTTVIGDGHRIEVSAALGMATATVDAWQSADDLIATADRAMYENKKQRRTRWTDRSA
jgi:diguanylate cyclase (GGDEF)-like protein